LKGGPQNDKLWGHRGKDRLSGQAGRDRLDGGSKKDVLNGGKGRDTAPNAGPDRLISIERTGTGFSEPFSGPRRYEYLAPTKITDESQLHQPLGQRKADKIARGLGMRKSKALTKQQFREFVSGGGVGGNRDYAEMVDASVRILTNTTGRPLISNVDGVLTPTVLASYGLMVNEDGALESPANETAPTRRVNLELAPLAPCTKAGDSAPPNCGYVPRWLRDNGAASALAMLYKSAYPSLAAYAFKSQEITGQAQILTNNKEGGVRTKVGMPMAPSVWLVNFALVYMMSPELAAAMPAYWAPIPRKVADALLVSEKFPGPDLAAGQVLYSTFARVLK
jgi:hypothetical protein